MTGVNLLTIQTERAWRNLRDRLDGLTDEEFFRQPVPDCWTVHPAPDGRWVLDYEFDPPEPPPFTTIGWRVVHLAACKFMYHEYAFGPGKLTWEELSLPHTAAAAVQWLEEGHARVASALAGLGDQDLDGERQTHSGEMWPTWRILWTLIYHDVHHGAEIGCLRRLFAAR